MGNEQSDGRGAEGKIYPGEKFYHVTHKGLPIVVASIISKCFNLGFLHLIGKLITLRHGATVRPKGKTKENE